jgi:DNA-binding NarL/FixJ family response regulator
MDRHRRAPEERRMIVADDQEIVRTGQKMILEPQPDLEV